MNFFKKAYQTIAWPGWVWVMILRKNISKSDALQLALYFTKYQGEGIEDIYDIISLNDVVQSPSGPRMSFTRVNSGVAVWVYNTLKQTELK